MIKYILPLFLASCVSAQITEDAVCDSQQISWQIPNLPSVPEINTPVDGISFTIPPVSKAISFDFSGDLNKISSITNQLNATINEMLLDNSNKQLNWVNSFEVGIAGSTSDTPSIVLLSYTDGSSEEQTINLLPSLLASSDTILNYFESGPITMTITLGNKNGTNIDVATLQQLNNLNGQVNAGFNVCMSVSAKISKSL